MSSLPPRRPRRSRFSALPERPASALGRPLPRAVTWLLLATGVAVAVALGLHEPWRSWLLRTAVTVFILIAAWRLGTAFPGRRDS